MVRLDLATADQTPPQSREFVPIRYRTRLGGFFPRTESTPTHEELTRHRHRWAEVSFVMACASPVRLVLLDEVVYRGRHPQAEEERRTSGLRGHLTPNPEAWRLDGLPEAFDVGPLRVVRREIAGRTSLAFRGRLRAVGDIADALEALVATLEPRA